MKILADESVERPIVLRLRSEGHQVLYIAEIAPGITDPEVLEIAYNEQALLITVDKDFGDLIFRKQHKSVGVMLMRLSEVLTSQEKANIVSGIVRIHEEELFFAFTVVTHDRLRVTRILPEQHLSDTEN